MSQLKFFTGTLNDIERESDRWISKWNDDNDCLFEITGIELIESENYGYLLLISYRLTSKNSDL